MTVVKGISSTTWTPAAGLPNGDYRWWVRASSVAGVAAWSQPADLQIGGQPAIRSTSPTTFEWQTVGDAVSYSLWISRLDGSGNVVNISGLKSTSYTLDDMLTSGNYRVWVRVSSITGQQSSLEPPGGLQRGGNGKAIQICVC
ncbi:MAG: hypothetical protein R3C49_06855 [Planctomycetaceae bacterium]